MLKTIYFGAGLAALGQTDTVTVSCVDEFTDNCVPSQWEGVLREFPWCDKGFAENRANGRVSCLAKADSLDECNRDYRCVTYADGPATFVAGHADGVSPDAFEVSEQLYTHLVVDATTCADPPAAEVTILDEDADITRLLACTHFAEVANPLNAFDDEDYGGKYDTSYNDLRCYGTDFTTFQNENTSIYECTKANPCPVSLRHNEPLDDLDDPFSLIGCGKCISVLSGEGDSEVVYHGRVVTYHTFEDTFENAAAIRDLVFLHHEATDPWNVPDDASYPPTSQRPYYFKVYDCNYRTAGCAYTKTPQNVSFEMCPDVEAEGSACTEAAPCPLSVEDGLYACGTDLVRDGQFYRVTRTHTPNENNIYWTPEFIVDSAVWSEALGQTSECSSIPSGPATEADVYFVDFTDIAEHQPTTTTSSTERPGSASGVAIGVAALVALAM